MTTIKFSATSTAAAATTLSVALGGAPAVGDLVVVFLSTDNEIVTHQPGYNTNNQWHQLQSYRCKQSSGNTLSVWHHTWNANDSGSTASFTFVAAPSLGVGDKALLSTNAMAVAVVLAGQTQYLDVTTLGGLEPEASLEIPELPRAANLLLFAGYSPDQTLSTAYSLVRNANLGTQNLSVWSFANPTVGLEPLVSASGSTDLATASITFSDTTTKLVYVTPYLEEGPVADNILMFRYKLLRHYTVLNNGGTFTAVRYQSTDQINAATQVFVNDAAVTSTDRTNILNSGVGGEFRATA